MAFELSSSLNKRIITS